jgi:hypothetical protein
MANLARQQMYWTLGVDEIMEEIEAVTTADAAVGASRFNPRRLRWTLLGNLER